MAILPYASVSATIFAGISGVDITVLPFDPAFS
jgi:hypothetical protein